MTVNCSNLANASSQSRERCGAEQESKLSFFPTEKIICYSIIYGIICLIALVGNSLVCFVIIKNPRMRTVTNMFLMNLAVADILFIIITVPPVLNIEIVKTYWIFGEVLCKTIPFINTVTLSISVYTMVVLAINRYYAIVHPFRAKLQHTVKRTLSIIALIWALSTPVAIPQILASKLLIPYPDRSVIHCTPDWSKLGGKIGIQVYSVVLFVIFFAVPITIISLAYTAIILRLRRTDRRLTETFRSLNNRGKNSEQRSLPISRNNRKTTFMMLTVIVVFLVCMLPFNVFLVASQFLSPQRIQASGKVFTYAHSILTVLAIGSSACNPIIYNFFSLKFRRAFADVFRCKCKEQPVGRTSDMTSDFNML